jgi:hypothetical protein
VASAWPNLVSAKGRHNGCDDSQELGVMVLGFGDGAFGYDGHGTMTQVVAVAVGARDAALPMSSYPGACRYAAGCWLLSAGCWLLAAGSCAASAAGTLPLSGAFDKKPVRQRAMGDTDDINQEPRQAGPLDRRGWTSIILTIPCPSTSAPAFDPSQHSVNTAPPLSLALGGPGLS